MDDYLLSPEPDEVLDRCLASHDFSGLDGRIDALADEVGSRAELAVFVGRLWSVHKSLYGAEPNDRTDAYLSALWGALMNPEPERDARPWASVARALVNALVYE